MMTSDKKRYDDAVRRRRRHSGCRRERALAVCEELEPEAVNTTL